jgi:ADP-ribose pyrophosphatase
MSCTPQPRRHLCTPCAPCHLCKPSALPHPTNLGRYRDLYASHREWVEKIAENMKPHTQARKDTNVHYKGKRVPVPDDLVPWSRDFPSYNPDDFTTDHVLNEGTVQGWADPRTPPTDLKQQRKSYEAPIAFNGGRPLNPRGRTGVRGRGLLGKWGPNHAADPIVTRYHPQTGKLQFVAVRREDTTHFAVPGGMVDSPGKKWYEKMHSSFKKEMTDEMKDEIKEDTSNVQEEYMQLLLDDLFHGAVAESQLVYRGCESSLEPGTLPVRR